MMEVRLSEKLRNQQTLINLTAYIRENHFRISDLVIDGQTFRDFVRGTDGSNN